MTTTTPSGDGRARRGGAFTLVEVMVAGALSVLILAGILSALLMIGRSAYNSSRYSEAETEIRQGLETFAEDARQATDIRWVSSQCLTFTVPTGANTTELVTYAYDSDPESATYQCFYRMIGAPDADTPRQVLVRGVAPDFAFQRYKVDQPGVTDNLATNDAETKQIQLSLRAVRTGITTVTATQDAISARFLLRNKQVAD